MLRSTFQKLASATAVASLALAGASVSTQAATTALNWGQVASTPSPQGRAWAASSFDSLRGVTVLFGGGPNTGPNFGDTWEWNGTTWTQLAPAASPGPLFGAAMAFDSRRGVSVLFGGSASPSSPSSSSTWEWDGTTWTERSFSVSPPARFWHAMAYDSARGRLVLFGGNGQSGLLGDTWEFDGTSWTQLFPANSPSPRFGESMAFDPILGRTVLFGGRGTGRLGDTWEWDGSNWTQESPSSAPFPRFFQSMAFDAQLGKTILFGGDYIRPYALGPSNDTWEFDGSQWIQDWTSSAPSPRAGQALVFDLSRSRVVLFGGTDETFSNPFFNDTWELGTGIITPPGSPATTFNPSSPGFGSMSVGVTSPPIAVTLSSSGTGPLLIGSISTTGDVSVVSTDCPVSPNPLAAGSFCIVLVDFTPTAAGSRSGALTVSDNGLGGAQSVPLSGTGTANPATLKVTSTTASFGGTAYITASLTSSVGPIDSASVSFTLPNGTSATLQTDVNGIATWATASVAGVNPGTYPGGIQASFAGNQSYLAASASATLTVTDSDLTLSGVPANVTVIAGSSSGAVVSYVAPAAIDETQDSSAATVSCAPSSGTTFAVGTTTVTCSASSPDDSPATVSETFTITVLVDLNVTTSVAPSTATTGTLVTGTVSLMNSGSAARTVTLIATFSVGDVTITSTKAVVKLNPGQSAVRTFTYRVSKGSPPGTYSFAATASDVTGTVSSATTFSVG